MVQKNNINDKLQIQFGELYMSTTAFAVWDDYKPIQNDFRLIRPSDIIEANNIIIPLSIIHDKWPNDNIVLKLLYKNNIAYLSLGQCDHHFKIVNVSEYFFKKLKI